MPSVLHITAHMGGGVGKVLSGIAVHARKNNCKFQHKILMLEAPEKKQFIHFCNSNEIEVVISSDLKIIEREIDKADIVQIEWWHHPKMAKFLFDFPKVDTKLIVWSHVSGCNYPILPFEFIKVPQCFLLTSQYSLENPYWSEAEKHYVKLNCKVINSSGGFDYVEKFKEIKHDHFNIGYVGTLSYSKLHPDFVEYCSAVKVPNAKFILIGDTTNQDSIEYNAKQKGILNKLEFPGYSNDIYEVLSNFDIFAYPLNPGHFGTTENALLEAMAFGLPVVALNQCAEKYLIKHMNTGLLANSIQEYAEHIKYLFKNPNERKRIGQNAREFVMSEFSVKKTVEKLNDVYDNVLKMTDKKIDFSNVFGETPSQWFLSCLGFERKYFEDSINTHIMKHEDKAMEIENQIKNSQLILKEKSKSSIQHFEKYYKNDHNIKYWKNLVKSEW